MRDSMLGEVKKFRCEVCKRMTTFFQKFLDGRKYWVCVRCQKDSFEILSEKM